MQPNLYHYLNLICAVVPAICLFYYIQKNEFAQTESPRTILRLIRGGIFSAIFAYLIALPLYFLFRWLLGFPYSVLHFFPAAAAIGEAAKLFFLKKSFWHSAHFNHEYSSLLYMFLISTGYIAAENVLCIFYPELSLRALLSIPAQLGVSVVCSVFYFNSKLYENHGSTHRRRFHLFLGWLSASVLNTVYNLTIFWARAEFFAVFLVFMAVSFLFAMYIMRQQYEQKIK